MTVKVTNGFGSNVNVNNASPNGLTVQPQVVKSHNLTGTPPAVKIVAENTDKKQESTISFEKQNASSESPVPPAVENTSTETDAEEKPSTSAERRDAMKRANAE